MTVTCERCKAALQSCPTNDDGFPLASVIFEVGNVSTVEMGHQLYHTASGRIAICAATRKQSAPEKSKLDRMFDNYQLSAQELIQKVGNPLATPADVIAALDSYGEGRTAGIHGMAENRGLDGMAENRGLDPAALTMQQYKDLLLEEADWSDKHAAHPVVQKDEADNEKRHAGVMRGIAERIVIA